MRILVRASVFLAGWAAYGALLRLLSDGSPDPNIGAGLVAFALVIVGAAVWGLVDGRRMDYSTVALTWIVVAVVVGVLASAMSRLTEDWSGVDPSVLVADILSSGIFLAGLVAVAALLGALVGKSLPRHGHGSSALSHI